jgi:CheY-like chemotaxis protein
LDGHPTAAGTLEPVPAPPGTDPSGSVTQRHTRLLLIEDSSHFQTLVSLVVGKHLPQAELHIADDGIAGLALAGKLEPDVLLVDIVLPGIDGATLITSLRSHPQFSHSQLVVVTGLDDQGLAPYTFALGGVPVVHKVRLVEDLPPLLKHLAGAAGAARASASPSCLAATESCTAASAPPAWPVWRPTNNKDFHGCSKATWPPSSAWDTA